MASERTLSIIKPDATRRNFTGKINARFEDAGLRIVVEGLGLFLREPQAPLSHDPQAGPFKHCIDLAG